MQSLTNFDNPNLPEEFRSIFIHTLHQIKQYGDAIQIAEFSFLVTGSLFIDDYGNKEMNHLGPSWRGFVYELFNNNQDFVDNRIQEIQNNQKGYIQNLYAQGIVYLWTSLESFIKRLLTELIKVDTAFLTNKAFEKLNISMTEYFKVEEKDKPEYLLDVIFVGLQCRYKLGIDRFECYLAAFGASGAFDNGLKDNLYYLHQIRNCIVHNDSIADKRFCEKCISLDYKPGNKILVTKTDYRVYEYSVIAYMNEVFIRINKILGVSDEFIGLLQQKIDNVLLKIKDAT